MDVEVLENYKKAGKIANTVLHKAAKMIQPGEKWLNVARFVDEEIKAMGGEPAFPVNLSRNDVAAHDLCFFEDERVFTDEDLIKIDVGVAVNGYVGDNAMTVDLTGNYTDLVQASRDAVHAAIKEVAPGALISDIGKAIEETINSYGFNPITNLSGHGVAQYTVHTSPSIPNYETGSSVTLKEDSVIAIEPFATTGGGSIREVEPSGIFSLKQTRPTRSNFVKEVQNTMKEFQGLPFARRWLDEKHGVGKVSLAIRELKQARVLNSYGPLVERSGGMVTQHEHTMIVKDKPIVTTFINGF